MSDTGFITLGLVIMLLLGTAIFFGGGGWLGLCLYAVVLFLVFGSACC